jgi:hypothetical protein
MTLVGMQLQLQAFDEMFIKLHKDNGCSLKETSQALLDNQQRKDMVDAMVKSESLSLKIKMPIMQLNN